MRFHAKYVSAAEAGDYYQVSFESEDPGSDATHWPGFDSPYLIIQGNSRHQMAGDATSGTHDHGYVGHYRFRLVDLSPRRLAIEIERKSNTHIEVSYALDALEFNEAQRITNIIFDQHG
jgi:hypothetical protein